MTDDRAGQPEYLIKAGGVITQAVALLVRFVPIYKTTDRGGWYSSERTGKFDTKRLMIRSTGETVTAEGQVRQRTSSDNVEVPRTAAGIKTAVRRLRPEEAVELTVLDAQIAEAKARLKALQTQRSTLVKTAWTRAHVVRLAEAEALIKEED